MRELTKSMIRFSWAISVLTFEQMSTLLGERDAEGTKHREPTHDTARHQSPTTEEPKQAGSSTEGSSAESSSAESSSAGGSKRKLSDRQKEIAETLDEVVDATGRHLSDRARTIYDSGDRLQSEMVDMVFDTFSTDRVSPDSVLDRAADLMDDMADALRRATGAEHADDGTAEGEHQPEAHQAEAHQAGSEGPDRDEPAEHAPGAADAS